MIEIGRLCVKTAGRDAGLKCVVVDVLDSRYVLIDGETRRRKCNTLHLEPLKEVAKIKKGASHEDIKKEFEKLGLEAKETKPKEKREKPVKQRTRKKTPSERKPGKKSKEKSPKEEKKKVETAPKKTKTDKK